MKIVIFADGASKGNPGPGGWGAIVSDGKAVRELGGHAEHSTNNRMELTAALQALQYAAALKKDAEAIVHTDSSYVINGITKWAKGWKAREWVTKEKKAVLNQDLWKPLLAAAGSFGKITWVYVGGHVGVAGNERVDAIASDFAENKKVALYHGPRSGYGIDVDSVSFNAELHAKKSASRTRSKAKAYSYVSRVDGKVQVHKTWGECEARVRGKKARYKKATSPEEEKNIIAEFSSRF